jgi:hypothetical protein
MAPLKGRYTQLFSVTTAMPLADDNSELEFGSFGTDRDIPITFRFRSDADAMVRLDLPVATDQRYADARNAVFTEAKLAADMGRGLSYSRRRDFYTGTRRYFGDTISYRTVLAAVDDGLDAGLLVERRARPGAHRLVCPRQSCIQATPLLCRTLNGAPVRSCLREVIWLRDRGGLICYEDTPETRQMRRGIEAINGDISQLAVDLLAADSTKAGHHWIAGGSYVVPAPPMVRRIFNRGSFQKGGRLYGWWQGLPSEYRAALTINGEPVLEPNFAQFHAAIIYGLRGIPLVGDAYETSEFPRAQGKLAFNIALNATNERTAVAAIAHHLNIERKQASLLLQAIKRKHKPIADVFCSDSGVSLMRRDSEITLRAVEDCHSRGIGVLPVHDSLIVPAHYAGHAAEAMVKAFDSQISQPNKCEVRIKPGPIPHMEAGPIPHMEERIIKEKESSGHLSIGQAGRDD